MKLIVRTVVLAVLVAAGLAVGIAPPAAATHCDGSPTVGHDAHLDLERGECPEPEPPPPPDPPPDPDDPNPGPTGPPPCDYWTEVELPAPDTQSVLFYFPHLGGRQGDEYTIYAMKEHLGEPPEEATRLIGMTCFPERGGDCSQVGMALITDWLGYQLCALWDDGTYEQGPTLQERVDDMYAQILENLEAPAVVVTPQPDEPTIIRFPVFLRVENYQDDLEFEDGGLVATVNAEPWTFVSGEPGADVLECPTAGRDYDPDLPVEAQQPPEWCYHEYTSRTSHNHPVDNRPEAWEGTLTMHWTATWVDSVTGEEGDFDPIELSSTIERSVDEVQAILQ